MTDSHDTTAGALRAPSQPEPRHIRLPPWPGLKAHTRHGDDRIYLVASPVYSPSDAVDMRCGHCVASSTVALDHDTRTIVFIVGHRRGCPAVADLLSIAGAP
jgi:hypothetical protein